MKINIEELGLKEISFTDFLGMYDENEINEIIEEMSTSGSYFDDWLEFYKEEDNELIECTLMTGSWEIIEHINNMKICENDPYVMIVKDSWFGENSDGDDVGYVSFEVLDGEELPTLKGGEYDKKSFMNQAESDEFSELSENEDIMYDVKYQDFYFVKSSEYNPKKWLEKWLSEDYGHNK